MEEPKKLIGGTDYPRTFNEFECFFKSEATCRAYLTSMRWPAGYEGPRCGSQHAPWITERGYLHCRDCGKESSVTAGTIFERTRIPLKTWVLALWFVTSQKHGASALGLKRVLGLGSYQTAWTWLHKLRRAMVRPGRDRLCGHIEVDETFVGGSNKGGKRGRGAERKAIVLIAVEVHEPKGFGRVRMRRVPEASGKSLIPFVYDNIEPGSTVLTDAWRGYNRVTKQGYTHITTNLSDSGDPAHVAMPGVHRIAALLKRWLLGIHQGAASGKHLEYYLDEYTFRFNRRTSVSRGLLFYRLMQQAVVTKPVSYRQIICDHDHNI
jgi:transposase-like protein